jgi:hypothetical protein
MYYPGNVQTDDITSISLPSGWSRIAQQPATTNSINSYTYTTGWSVGAKVSGSVSEKPSLGAELNASYSQANSASTTVNDLIVVNNSNSAVSSWSYKNGPFFNNIWKNMFTSSFMRMDTANEPVAFAKATLTVNNESIYQLPISASGSQNFQFKLTHHVAKTNVTGNWSSFTRRWAGWSRQSWQSISVNLDAVRPIGDKGLKGNYYNWPSGQGVSFVFDKKDPIVNINWGLGKPDSRITSNSYYVQWNGFIKPPYDGQYTFTINAQGAYNLSVYEQSVIPAWVYGNNGEKT